MRVDEDHTSNCETTQGKQAWEAVHGSFGEFLGELHSLFPPELLGEPGWERMLALAHRLPVHVADQRFGFEFDLCDPEPAADFCVVPSPGSRLADFYVRQGELASPDSAAAALGAFLTEQASDPQGLLSEGKGGVILEYDLVGISSEQPAPPGVFIVTQDLSDKSHTQKLYGDPEPLAAALWAAAGRPPDTGILRQAQKIYDALPAEGYVSQAGVMPGRAKQALRFIVRLDSAEDVVEMLMRLDWPGSPAQAAETLDGLEEVTKPVVGLSIDVTKEGISHRAGMELFRPVEWYKMDRSGWTLLIDRLTDKGLCLPGKARGLKAWPQLVQMFTEDGVYRVLQTINHVKLVVDRGETTAKAYAGMYVLRGVQQMATTP